MDAIIDQAPGEDADQALVVMLPGARDRAQDLVDQGFVRALRARELAVDAIVVDARMDDYVERSVMSCLEREIIAPAQACAGIWLMGISLGGMGALEYAREHTTAIAGVILLAPFFGTRGLLAEVARAGGLMQWNPGPVAPADDERRLLAWLRSYRAESPGALPIYLGYGTEDRYAGASIMLAERLPANHVVAIKGGRDWLTWTSAWEHLLDDGVLSGSRRHASGCPTAAGTERA